MSIFPANMTQQVASATQGASTERHVQAPLPAAVQTSAPAAPLALPKGEAEIPVSVVAPPAHFSTDLRIDAEHQLYYQVTDDSDGAVLFEIPSEALRAIGESLSLPLAGDLTVPIVDVRS